jgi:hypothetical protein
MMHHRTTFGAVTLMLFFAASLQAQDRRTAITDPEKAGVDYQIQGEYQSADGADEKWGAQIIAEGGGKFRAIGYRGGLPGDGWDGERHEYVSGELQDGALEIDAGDFEILVKDGEMQVNEPGGGRVGTLKKVHRESPTLGAKPPEGAIVLFDGTSVDQWENAKLVEDKYLGATNCSTKEKFGDHTLHIEFRTPFMPAARDQGRGNSGVYVQSRYEVQVLDSFGLSGEDNECGGIYQVSKPKVNMCYPPLAWQTYDIDFTAARYDADGKKTENALITVKHNGVVIHENLELPHGTPGRFREGPEPMPVFLQDHGNPVVFRNIWAVKK